MKELRGRTLVSAGLVREFFFISEESFAKYLQSLRGPVKVLKSEVDVNGTVRAIIVTGYNNTPLWEGINNDD